jgi:peptidoglycan-N-acetylglucosamine deacetylase
MLSVVVLTFDDGPDPRWTPAVLDALATADARASFFVLGSNAVEYPEPIARALAEGHAVEVHGYDHLRHTDTPRAEVEADLCAALEALAELGAAPRRFRAPYGALAPWTQELAAEHGLALTTWTVDTNDWRGDDAGAMLEAVRTGLAPGAIVLAHDAVGPGARRAGCEETVRLIAPLVAEARARGLDLTNDW